MNKHRSCARAFAAGMTLIVVGLGASQQAFAQDGSAYTGIYTGTFDSSFDNGPFVVMVRPNGVAIVTAFDLADNEAVIDENVSVGSNGRFSDSALGGEVDTSATGQFTFSALSGTFAAGTTSGEFSSARNPDTGATAGVAGYYKGTYEGTCAGNVTVGGELNAILAADETILLLIPGAAAIGGSDAVLQRTLSIGSSNQASFGGEASNGAVVLGTVNLSTATASGSWDTPAPESCENAFELVRAVAAVPRLDSDVDGIPDVVDNCPVDANAGQADTNGDGVGNACERRRISALISALTSVLLDD